MELLQRLDEQVVDREPDWPAPVGVAAEQAARRFRRLVGDAVGLSFDIEHVWLGTMHRGKGADAVRREELALVEEAGKDAA